MGLVRLGTLSQREALYTAPAACVTVSAPRLRRAQPGQVCELGRLTPAARGGEAGCVPGAAAKTRLHTAP
jgi:hypothetical protein